jgi:O-acetyl-ADP-ribose deacetylase (regulator of RNase III)
MDPVALSLPVALRHLTPAEAPFAGALRAGDPPTLWVDAAEFAESPAWAAVDAEHILAPLDAAGTPEGPCIVLPHCPVRLDDVMQDAVVSPGALVTLAVSALRGAAEADRIGAEHGRWWVTTEGRPVLALTGSSGWREETVALLRAAGERAPHMRAVLARTADAVADPRLLRRGTDEIEAALFAAAEAEALPTELREVLPAAPSRARTVTTPAIGAGIVGTVRDLVARLVDAAVADRVHRAAASVRVSVVRESGKTAAPATRRRRVVVVAAAAAACVVVAGALWPAGEAERPAAAGEASATSAPRSSDEAERASPSVPAPGPAEDQGPEGVVAAARALVDAVRGCEDETCREGLWEDPATAAAIEAAAGESYGVQVVDEYGGVAAVRIVGEAITQILVMVQSDEKWLVREVYDLADQP